MYEAEKIEYSFESSSSMDGGKYKSVMLAIGGNEKENSKGKVVM
jgi:hypothetical protein